jgi:hypothetical protein
MPAAMAKRRHQNEEKIKSLREKRDQLNKQIRQAEAQKVNAKRREDTRRKVLIGAAIMARVANGKEGWSEEKLQAMMDNFLVRDQDRELFDLEPLPIEQQAANSNQKKSGSKAKSSKKTDTAKSDGNGSSSDKSDQKQGDIGSDALPPSPAPDSRPAAASTTEDEATTTQSGKQSSESHPATQQAGLIYREASKTAEEAAAIAPTGNSATATDATDPDADAENTGENGHSAPLATAPTTRETPSPEDKADSSKGKAASRMMAETDPTATDQTGDRSSTTDKPRRRLPEVEDDTELEKEFNI